MGTLKYQEHDLLWFWFIIYCIYVHIILVINYISGDHLTIISFKTNHSFGDLKFNEERFEAIKPSGKNIIKLSCLFYNSILFGCSTAGLENQPVFLCTIFDVLIDPKCKGTTQPGQAARIVWTLPTADTWGHRLFWTCEFGQLFRRFEFWSLVVSQVFNVPPNKKTDGTWWPDCTSLQVLTASLFLFNINDIYRVYLYTYTYMYLQSLERERVCL